MKYSVVLFFIWIISVGASEVVFDKFTLQTESLSIDKTWSGVNVIAYDITIPKTVTLTLAEGTWLIFNSTKLNVEGTLKNLGAKISHIDEPDTQAYLQAYTLAPEPVSLEPLKKTWWNYRVQYAVVWSVIFAIPIFL